MLEKVSEALSLVFGRHKTANQLLKLVNGEVLDKEPKDREGGSLNQDGERRIVFLLWAMSVRSSQAIRDGLDLMIEWHEGQLEYGHMSGRGDDGNEAWITGHHLAIYLRIWGAELRAIEWLEQRLRADSVWRPEFLRFRELALASIGGELASWALHSSPEGDVVTLGTRYLALKGGVGDDARDALMRELLGLPQFGPAARKGWWKTSNAVSVGPALIRLYLPTFFGGLIEEVRRNDLDALACRLPKYRDAAALERHTNGHMVYDLSGGLEGWHHSKYGTTIDTAIAYYGPPTEVAYGVHGLPQPVPDMDRLGPLVWTIQLPVVD